MINIALTDDHVIMRKALALVIGKRKGFRVVTQADHGKALLAQLDPAALPDIVVLDIDMPVLCGVETAILLRQQHPSIKVVVLTEQRNDFVRERMLKSGVRAYLHKDCHIPELFRALREVHENGYYFNERLPPNIVSQRASFYEMRLNGRQRCFLRWASTELTHREIAEKMKVSPRTVDSYRDILFKKLDINSRVGLVLYAVRNGFVWSESAP